MEKDIKLVLIEKDGEYIVRYGEVNFHSDLVQKFKKKSKIKEVNVIGGLVGTMTEDNIRVYGKSLLYGGIPSEMKKMIEERLSFDFKKISVNI